MLTAGRNQEALKSADDTLSHLVDRSTPYDDAASSLNWLLQGRANALSALGRWSEAEQTYRWAIGLQEEGRPNVSQRLNLASLLASMGRVEDARRVIGLDVTVDFRTDRIDGVSPYGAMVFARVKLRGALLAKDQATTDLAFAYLKRHRRDSEGMYRSALLMTHRSDEYAQALVEDLRDPLRRADALVNLQDYEHLPDPPGSIDLRPEEQAAQDRPDVQQAIREVGSIQKFALPGVFH